MKQVTVGTTPTLLAAGGNRDFLNIYNNDSNPIFVVYDGGDPNSTPPATISIVAAQWSSGFPQTVVVLNLVVPAGVDATTFARSQGIQVSMVVTGTGIPSAVAITALTINTVLTGQTLLSLTVASFTTNANSGATVTVGWTALTTSIGFPIAPGDQLYISNDGGRNAWMHPVYAISTAGGADVRIQGA